MIHNNTQENVFENLIINHSGAFTKGHEEGIPVYVPVFKIIFEIKIISKPVSCLHCTVLQ